MTAAQVIPHATYSPPLSGPGVALSDLSFLQRYIDNRDEAAFAALVERHGPMVLELCQAILSTATTRGCLSGDFCGVREKPV